MSAAAPPAEGAVVLGPDRSAAGEPLVEEVVGARTRTSRTYIAPDGTRIARVYSGAVNFRDGRGKWRPIRNDLERRGDVYVNAGNTYRAELPTRLGSRPVRVTVGDAWVAFRPRGAAGSVRVQGSTARYDDAWPGVDALYTAHNDGLKEDLVLRRSDSARAFAFDLEASHGLRPRLSEGGTVTFVRPDGRVQMWLGSPFMRDAAGRTSDAVHVSLREERARAVLVYEPDRQWLSENGRAWPVMVDPQVSPGADQDCTIEGSQPGLTGPMTAAMTTTTGACAAPTLALYTTGGCKGHTCQYTLRRPLVRFDVDAALPAGADVDDASLGLYLSAQSGTTGAMTASVYTLTKPWTNDVTWTHYDGVNRWTRPGGDVGSYHDTISVGGSGGVGRYYRWNVRGAVQAWASGVRANHGFQLQEDSAPGPVLTFNSREHATVSTRPYLEIVYEPRGGVRRGHTYDSYRITDRSSLSVNIADGNLLLSAQDLEITGTGLDLSLQRYFNSRDAATGELGQGGRFSLGRDIELNECVVDGASNSRCLIAPSGFRARFQRQADGSFKTPPGMNATLKRNGDGTFTLTDHRSGQKMHFLAQAASYMSSIEDRHDNRIRFDYSAGGLSKITDTQGREVAATLNGSGDIATITDRANRRWVYDYHPGTRRLWRVTLPDGSDTEYYYNAQGRLSSIIDPRGSEIVIGYDAAGRVASVRRQVSDNRAEDVTTTYVYSRDLSDPCSNAPDSEQKGRTELTDPRGKTTIYCWDGRGRVRKTKDADGNRRSRTYTSNDDVATFTELEGTAAATFQFNYDSSTNNLTGGQGAAGEVFGIGYCGQSGEPACHSYEQARHQPTSVTSPNGSKTHMTYNATGDMTRIGATTSGAAHSVDLEYRDGSGGEPDDGQLEWAEDGRDNRTTFGYDADGNLNEIDPPGTELGKTTFTHDSLSRITSVRDGRHQDPTGPKQIQDITYDGVDRVTRIDYGDGSWFAFTYDPNGNLASRTDSFGNATSYVYDRRNLRVSEDLPGTAFNAYSYDAAGNLATLTDPGGTVSYGYDDINRVTSVTEPGGATIILAYDDNERHSTITFPGGIWQRTHTDKSGKMTSIAVRNSSGTLLRRLDYDYADNAFCAGTTTAQRTLVQKVTDHNNRTTCYEYDLLDRLSYSETRNSAGNLVESFDYDFDGASNRTKKVHRTPSGTTTTSYAYNEANQLCWRASGDHSGACGSAPAGAVDYDHDAAGNETDEEGGRASSYDIRNRLTNLSGTAFGYLTATNGELVSVGASALQNNLLGLGRQDSTSYTRTPDGTVLSQRGPSSTEYYLRDRLDSTIGLISGTSITRDYSYDPDGNASSTGSGATTNIRFAGGHTTNGLYHFGARYYDPNIARWTQPDPMRQHADLKEANRYTYATSDPVNRTDSTGLFSLDWGDVYNVYSTVEAAMVTVGFGVATVAGTVACFAATVPTYGLASAACLGYTAAMTSATVAWGYVTYRSALSTVDEW